MKKLCKNKSYSIYLNKYIYIIDKGLTLTQKGRKVKKPNQS